MTLPTADLISEVLRLDEEAFGGKWEVLTDGCGWTCVFSQYGDGGCIIADSVGDSLYEHEAETTAALIAHYRTSAPELARRLRDAEEKLARANEALCLVIGLAEEGVRSLRRSPSCHQEHICEDEETLARVRAIIAALKEPVT